jgi:plasmid rolling circle replication initiator protein Rep
MNDFKLQDASRQHQQLTLSDVSAKDDNWRHKRSQTQDISKIYSNKNEYEKLSNRISNCSLLLGFAELINKSTGEIQYRLRQGNFCHARFCAVCGWRRSKAYMRKVFERLPKLQKEYSKHRFLFLTLTVQNPSYEDLRSTIIKMNEAWHRLIKRKEFKSAVAGWIRTTEVTDEQKRKGYSHPHFHIVLMVPPSYFSHAYITQSRWLQLWQEAMRDDEITQVNIKKVHAKSEGDDAVRSSILETIKYAVKPEETVASPEFLYCVTKQLRGLRFIATGGLLKDVMKDEVSDAEMIGGDEESKEEDEQVIKFAWHNGKRNYLKRDNNL